MPEKSPEKFSGKLEAGGRELRRIHYQSNRRKAELYWLGFLQGAMASGRVEQGEVAALQAEARAFARFFDDPDALDLIEDIAHVHDARDNDLYEQLDDIVGIRRKALKKEEPFSDKDRVNEFLGFCAGIICDGEVLESEAAAIIRRFSSDEALSGHPHLIRLRDTLEQAMADNRLSGREAEDVKEWVTRIVGDGYADTGLPSLGNTSQLPEMLEDHAEIVFEARIFVVTGALRIGPRWQIEDLVRARSGLWGDTITKKTHYVIVAPTASRDWVATHFGRKIEKAQKYIAAGAPLRFVPEHVFERALEG